MMYRIIRASDGVELGMTDHLTYIKYGKSGCFVSATQAEAIGVAFQSTPYNLIGHEEIKDAETVLVCEVDGGSYLAQNKSMTDMLIATILEG